MEEKLISKKELLQITDISYGQLYRWKRKKIIPEEWFIKKSVSTGQETFFPEEKILERIREILRLKDTVSLDELSAMFSNEIKKCEISRKYIVENIIPEYILEMFENKYSKKERYNSDEVLFIVIFKNMLESGSFNFEEIISLIEKIKENFSVIKDNEILIIKRKLGVLFYYLTEREEEIIKDDEAKVLLKLNFFEIKKYISRII
ncbi:hypothetical protein HMPREF1092_01633 [Clostridium thermobutyricum]|uniref:DUF4004 domain-containing protein n=1 Tax=Clostridium thermobutyricum TaxID=29372 RepID=N9XRS0_9CLOT|nr:DUF4004 family protein [Clostridium thermobutyricum]ENZ02398.1 hypothetical protein HMPREF1092_01633 [Clostridium thermobutyricum]